MNRNVCECGKPLEDCFMCDECFKKEEERRRALPPMKRPRPVFMDRRKP
jgi:hypothetical protein